MRTGLWIAGLLAGCATVDPAELQAPGPYGVGYQQLQVEHDPGDGPRALRVAAWYPTLSTASPAPFRYDGLWPAVGVTPDAPPAGGRFPLVLHSHGHQAYAESSSRLLAHVVSHGAVVLAPEHLGNTVFDGDARRTDIYWKRSADVSATLDAALAPSHPLAGAIDGGVIIGFGHSFGGYTMQAVAGARYDTARRFAACDDGEPSPFCSTLDDRDRAAFEAGGHDPRVGAIAVMAPGDHRLFGDAGLAAIQVPVMLMTGGLDDVEQGDLHWGGLAAPGNVRVHVDDAGHLAWTDFAPGLEDRDYIEPERGWEVFGAYLVAFVRQAQGERGVRSLLRGEPVIGDSTAVLTAD